MPAIQLTVAERKTHRAEAHHLEPVVMVGNDGLTPAVKKEADAALNAHGLIKIRVLGDDRAEREAMLQQLADELNAAPIQHIGKLLVLWRPKPKKERPAVTEPAEAAEAAVAPAAEAPAVAEATAAEEKPKRGRRKAEAAAEAAAEDAATGDKPAEKPKRARKKTTE